MGRQTGAEKAELLLSAARYLNETLELERVYERFHELLADAVPHSGVIVSSFDPENELISCDYAWVDGGRLDPTILPPLRLNREGGGMQSRVIVSGEPLLVNDVPERVSDPGGVYYDVDREGRIRKIPEEGPPGGSGDDARRQARGRGRGRGAAHARERPLRPRAARARGGGWSG